MNGMMNPFVSVPDCVESRGRLKGVIADLFPGEIRKGNLLMIAYDAGIADGIRNSAQLDEMLYNRFIMILVNDFGVAQGNAAWVVRYWFTAYGVEALRKQISTPLKEEFRQPVAEEAEKAPCAQAPARIACQPILLTAYKENEKLPKELFDCFPDGENHGISSVKCTFRKGYVYDETCHLEIRAEYEGKIDEYLVFFFKVYNAAGEMIGANFDEETAKELDGRATLSISIILPSDESISRIELRVRPDPAFL